VNVAGCVLDLAAGQGKSLALDVTPVLATEAFVLTAPDLFEGL
jgi:hypothetical protein